MTNPDEQIGFHQKPLPATMEDFVRLGLTKREHFAALAMQGLLCNPKFVSEDANFISALAVEHADALISQLNATPAP